MTIIQISIALAGFFWLLLFCIALTGASIAFYERQWRIGSIIVLAGLFVPVVLPAYIIWHNFCHKQQLKVGDNNDIA